MSNRNFNRQVRRQALHALRGAIGIAFGQWVVSAMSPVDTGKATIK
jgi:hypothetical protein